MNDTDDPFVVLENKLNENKKEKMIDELLGGMETHQEGDWRLCPRTGTLEVYNNGEWIVA